MRTDALTLAASLFLLATVPARADDPALDNSSLFKRRAQAISELHVLDLEKRAGDLRRDQGISQNVGAEQKMPAKALPLRLIEIYGSGNRLFASFRLSDGEVQDFAPGQTVPGLGKIRSITPQAVEDGSHHFHTVETPREIPQ